MDFVDFSSPERKYQNAPSSYDLPDGAASYTITPEYEIPGSSMGAGSPKNSDNQPTEPETPKSIWSIEFYQKYFDVNTDEVLSRIMWSMLPSPNVNFLQHFIQNKPDLYGPFWICTTLVFAIGISGNIANYFQSPADRNYEWTYNFHAVSLAGFLIFLYAWMVPVVLWGALQWSSVSEVKFKLLELICVYGYAMAIYIPLSVLWIIPVGWVQWVLTFVGACLSGLVLCMALRPAFTNSGYTVLILLFVLHLVIATCFMRFFFHVSKNFGPNSLIPPAAPAMSMGAILPPTPRL
ncbi:Yip1 domain family member 1 [Nesidiocoris tenuis]|uniref:Protein YIPF n=1 Tax=Nesidiocoris tenuis TaxID=355587 RepID=A0ABN7AI14_9HEMI|nr:Yip1 domain family member 1 [Nesidiocoris tenuis]